MDGELVATSVEVTGEVNATSGITFDSSSRLTISSSAQAITASLTTLSASAAAVTGAAHQDSITAIGVTSASLLTASSSMATQVTISPTGVDVKNETGGTISSFSTR